MYFSRYINASSIGIKRVKDFFAQESWYVEPWTRNRNKKTSILPEVCFIGRTNVGKSSLINALVGDKALVKTSKTPGYTRQMNIFSIASCLHLVDVPGYGFGSDEHDMVTMGEYLQVRRTLRQAYLLINAEHGIKNIDAECLKTLEKCKISFQLVLTKCDGIGEEDIKKAVIGKNPLNPHPPQRTTHKFSYHPPHMISYVALIKFLRCRDFSFQKLEICTPRCTGGDNQTSASRVGAAAIECARELWDAG